MSSKMEIKEIPINKLSVNRANDRHGELENETAAIAWLFNTREVHMRNLSKDLAAEGTIYEPPLVSPDGEKYLVFDGNRRVTCLKLILDPRKAPTNQLQSFFEGVKKSWNGDVPTSLDCQVEQDRERIDNILFRRHTGTQSGIGQSTWDDRMKSHFVARTGQQSGFNVAQEVEHQLAEAGLLPEARQIPRSTMNRLLSAEPFRNRVGFSVRKKRFEFTHDKDVVLKALARVANDLATRTLVLGDIWDVDGKRAYLDQLEKLGVLPTAEHALSAPVDGELRKPGGGKPTSPGRGAAPSPGGEKPVKPTAKPPKKSERITLIPQKDFQLSWPGRLQRQHQIWEELQFQLRLTEHPNAVSVLFRVLLELSVKNYVDRQNIALPDGEKFAKRALKVAEHMHQSQKIEYKQLEIIRKFQHADQIISAHTLNQYVHSPNLAPSPEHLTSMWDSLAEFIVQCLEA